MATEVSMIDFLKHSIQNKFYDYIKWFYICFTIPKSDIEIPDISLNYSNKDHTIYYTMENNDYLVTSISKYPIIMYNTPITVDETWFPLIDKKIDTTIGRLLANSILLYDNFNTKIPYINDSMEISYIETIIAEKLIDDTDNPPDDKITVSEYTNFIDSVTYMESFAFITNISSTEKNIIPPSGIDQFRKKLIKELSPLDTYEKISEFENRLKEYDKEYLKDDPSYGKYLKGKLVNVSRKKTMLTIGTETTFDKTFTPILIEESLSDGWPKDPDKLVELYNGSRAGSFSRGAETVKGGLSAKIILRALNHYLVADEDCKTKLTTKVMITNENIKQYLSRYIMVNGNPVLITDSDKDKYIGKIISLRTPLYCNANKGYFCPICLGKRNSEIKTGISLAATEISSIILNTSMKAMHGTALTTVEIDLEDILK